MEVLLLYFVHYFHGYMKTWDIWSQHTRALVASFSWTSFAEEVGSYCCKFYSEEDKHIAVNRFSIAEAELYSKELIKNVYISKYTYLNMYGM